MGRESERLVWFPILGFHTLGNSPHVHGRTQDNVYALADEFGPHVLAALTHQFSVPPAFIVRQDAERGSRTEAHVAAAFMPAGNAVTRSANRTPSGASYKRPQHLRGTPPRQRGGNTSKQRPGKSPTGGMFPTHGPFIQPTPVVILTFSSSVKP